MDCEEFDAEGRLITLEYQDFYVINVYVPSVHPHNAPDRPDYRLEWDAALRKYISGLSKPVILCGDFNATRAYIDSYPDNGKNEPDTPLFRSETREGLERLLSLGLVCICRAAVRQLKRSADSPGSPKPLVVFRFSVIATLLQIRGFGKPFRRVASDYRK